MNDIVLRIQPGFTTLIAALFTAFLEGGLNSELELENNLTNRAMTSHYRKGKLAGRQELLMAGTSRVVYLIARGWQNLLISLKSKFSKKLYPAKLIECYKNCY